MARKMLIDGELNNQTEEEAHYDFDLFVIGAGSGGVRAARFSANFGAKVGICELPFHPISSEVIGGVGGTCVIRGCVPKKILVYGASFGGEIEDARNYGWEVNEKVDFNWKKLLQKKTDEIVRLNGIYKRLLSNAGVKLYEGEGKVVGPNEVEVTQLDGTKLCYSAKHILIATGSRAQRPAIPGQELGITSDEALSLDELPKRAVVLGGGYIAVEFASIWRGLGAAVDLFFRKELPLRGFDDEMRAVVARNLEGRGINMHPRTNLTELIKTEDGIKVVTDHGEELIADVVLFATGRLPNTKRLNLQAVGVEVDQTGAVKVDEYSRTNIASIWAVGDVTNRMNLTPVALMEGTYFAKTVFGGQPSKPDYNNIPYAVFSIPPLSVVGLSEEQALEQAKADILVFTSTFNPMKNTVSGRQEKTVMKLVVDGETDKVLGASMCGPDAPEIMQGIAIALKCGATKAQFDGTVGIHPSAAEEFVTMRTVTRRISKTEAHQAWTPCLHAFADLSYVSPVVFLYLLKECYVHGTCKATKKFRALQQQVHQVLFNAPQPEPATFVVQCLYILPIFGLYCEGFSHLVISALRRFLKAASSLTESLKAKNLAARLFVDIVVGTVGHDERVIVKLLEAFNIGLPNVDEAICQLRAQNDCGFDGAQAFVEQYIFRLIESQSYMAAVTLLEHFSIHHCGESFLLEMLQKKEFKAAEKWATFMGKQLLCALVEEYAEKNMLKDAYEIVKKNNLHQEFPGIYHKCKESSVKKLAEKACWDIAEAKANGDKQLLEYLVYLAMEAGYSEKVDELCTKYSLEGFVKAKEAEVGLLHSRFLYLDELSGGDIIWVDEVDGLHTAASHIEGCKVVGIDCEWKPNYVKGSKPNKVSIMQIASDKKVFIFDLIKLSEDVPDTLNNCLIRILQSPRILKLGYNFQCDVKQLAHSYGELECFKQYEMLLDIQNVFREPQGGLSGLAQKILGVGLNKTRRNSNWEQRPLSRHQLEYAALDAVVLIHIFHHICGCSQPDNLSEGHEKIEWKSHIVSHIDNGKKSKKECRSKKKFAVGMEEHSQ